MGQTQSPAAPPVEESAFWGSPITPESGLRPPPPPAARRLTPPSRAAERATLSTAWLGECLNVWLTKRHENEGRQATCQAVRGGGDEEGGKLLFLAPLSPQPRHNSPEPNLKDEHQTVQLASAASSQFPGTTGLITGMLLEDELTVPVSSRSPPRGLRST